MKNINLRLSLLLGVFTLFFITSLDAAYAQNEKGNGGRAWVCYGPKDPTTGKREITKVELLDYVEARSVTTWNIDLGMDSPGIDDTDVMIEAALSRLKKYDAWRVQEVRAKLQELKNPVLTKILDLDHDRVGLSLIADANVLISPPEGQDCLEQQAAFNKTNPGPKQFKYAFVRQFLDKMSDADRAGLFLHEAIYNLEASLGATDSDGVREQVRAWSSPSFQAFTLRDYESFVRRYSKKVSLSDRFASYFSPVLAEGETDLVSSGVLALDAIYPKVSVTTQTGESRRVFNVPITAKVGTNVILNKGLNEAAQIQEWGITQGGKLITPSYSVATNEIRYWSSNQLILHSAVFHNIKTVNKITGEQKSARSNQPTIYYPSLEPAYVRFWVDESSSLRIPHESSKTSILSGNGSLYVGITFESGILKSINALFTQEHKSEVTYKDTSDISAKVSLRTSCRNTLTGYPVHLEKLFIDLTPEGKMSRWYVMKTYESIRKESVLVAEKSF